MSPTRIRLMVLVSHPIQYFVPVYRELSKRDDLDFSVLYRTRVGVDSYFDPGFGKKVKWDIDLLNGYPSRFLSTKLHTGGVELSIVWQLIKNRPDVLLLHGYNGATNLLALLLARLLGSRVLMRGDTRLSACHKEAAPRSRLKRLLFRLVDGCVSIGSHNRDYYKWLGVSEERIFFAPFSVENAAFALGYLQPSARVDQRRKMGIRHDATVVVFASKLIARKRAIDLLEAMKMVWESHEEVVLVVAGSGPEERNLREAAEPFSARIRFVGFKNQAEMPALLAAGDVFVLPSEAEPWGLVVNEAMAAGLPVIVSDDVGAAIDLVEGTGTGFVYPVGDIVRLADALKMMLGSCEARKRMGKKSVEVIDSWSVAASAAGIAAAAISVFERQAG